MLYSIDGRLVYIDTIGSMSDDDLIDLAMTIHEEVQDRIGRCRLCHRKHPKFHNCPDHSKVETMRAVENEFEKKLKKRLAQHV